MSDAPVAVTASPNTITRLVRRQYLGLRNRVVLFFALGALLLSAALSISTYTVVRHTLVEQRETLAERQTYSSAATLKPGLRAPSTGTAAQVDVPSQLSRLQNPSGTETVLYYDGQWFATDPLQIGQNTLPSALRDRVLSGTPARMRFKVEGKDTTYIAVGVPIPSVGASYFDVSTFDDVDRSLSILLATLFFTSIITTIGGALLGRWSTRSVLRPLTQAATAAEEIVGGNRTTRLTPGGDKDMDRLVVSFNRMVDALQGRIERDARFASDVSHELRSPLMTLASGMAVLQARRDELPARSQTALDLLSDEVNRFQRMVQDLLEISRTDADQQELHLDEVLAGEFVERVVEAYGQQIPVHGDPAALDAILSVDKRRMERVIGNLIENADRYAGGVVEISLEETGPDVRILVDDAGPGVPLEERQRIFERFARGAEARARASGEGTGLGLSLVYEHVAMHNGQVWVEGRPEGGARFVVQLPKVEL